MADKINVSTKNITNPNIKNNPTLKPPSEHPIIPQEQVVQQTIPNQGDNVSQETEVQKNTSHEHQHSQEVAQSHTTTGDYTVEYVEPSVTIAHGYDTTSTTAPSLFTDHGTGEIYPNENSLLSEPLPFTWNITGPERITEGQSATYTISYTGYLAPGEQASIQLTTNSLSHIQLPEATPGIDFDEHTNTLYFHGGQGNSIQLTVSAIVDNIVEGDEIYAVSLNNPSTGGISQGIVNTIIDDVTPITLPQWNISGDPVVHEGNIAQYTISYNGATLANNQTMTIQVHTSTPNLTITPDATSGVDFDPIHQTLTFHEGGPTSIRVFVQTNNDSVYENEEEYAITISQPNAGYINDAMVRTVIQDTVPSEESIEWSITGDHVVAEGHQAAYVISHNGSLSTDTTIKLDTGVNALVSTATPGTDYDPIHQTLTFHSNGPSSALVFVQTNSDSIPDDGEKFSVGISDQSTGTIIHNEVVTEIRDLPSSTLEWNISGTQVVNEGNTAQYTISYNGGV